MPDAGPVLGVSAVVLRDGRLLAVRRGPDSPLPGRWSLPGGRVEPGERLAAAVRRELLEETGLRVRVAEQVAVREHPPWVILVFRADVTGGTLRAGDDVDRAEWVEPLTLLRRRTTPGLRDVLRRAGVL